MTSEKCAGCEIYFNFIYISFIEVCEILFILKVAKFTVKYYNTLNKPIFTRNNFLFSYKEFN